MGHLDELAGVCAVDYEAPRANGEVGITPLELQASGKCLLKDLPFQVLLGIALKLDRPHDLASFLTSCKPCAGLNQDPQFVAGWLVTHRRQHALVTCCSTGHSKAALRLLNACESPLKRTPSRPWRATPEKASAPRYQTPNGSHLIHHGLALGDVCTSEEVQDPSLVPMYIPPVEAELALCAAAGSGHAELVAQLLRWGIPADGLQQSGKPIIAAAQAGHLACVSALVQGQEMPSLRHDEQVHCPPKAVKRALFEETPSGEMNASDIKGPPGCRALCAAAKSGHVPVVQMLLDSGVVSQQAKRDAMVAAAGAGHVHMLQFMVQSGRFSLNDTASSAFMEATQAGHVNVMSWLWSWQPPQTSKPNRPRTDTQPPDILAGILFSRLAPPDAIDNGDMELKHVKAALTSALDPALILAAGLGHQPAVELLLKWGADENAASTDNSTALQRAAAAGHLEVLKMLVAAGADPNVNEGTPLRLACLNEKTSVVRFLLELGADMPADTASLLSSAAQKANLELVRLLLAAGVDPHAADEGALRCAASAGAVDVVRELLAPPWHADVHANDDEALLWAVDNGQEEVVQVLLEHGALAAGPGGEDMLWRAVMLQHQGIIAALMDAGARLASGDNQR